MKTVYHAADSRGHANHGWLNTHHTFSFGSYRDARRTNFGVLRVLNDDEVAAGRGFGSHPHDNMEIISIPLEGDLEHKDSMGNTTVIRQGDIQVMSAGTGVVHSEKNKHADREVKFLQIWVFPNARNVTPRYDQLAMDADKETNAWQQVLAPQAAAVAGTVWIHQDAYFSIGRFDAGTHTDYTFNKAGHGVYLFILEGSAEVDGQQLGTRDGLGVTATERFTLIAGPEGARVLAMEVPMN
ncbi:Quercetin 2,3-dioxygenase [Neolewinella maritima]|uniref:Quercetin 2,3-dioxygenase n=1 Tax=Neolewinella maritima TaxID=1383882 RepID=A0ABM9AWC8_9BACT|nr:pirin family protein [Neolewinella maritima]CAH0999011.1 Quercetin 2,3-dioxygenase [Neolewinella maritima]